MFALILIGQMITNEYVNIYCNPEQTVCWVEKDDTGSGNPNPHVK